MLFNNGDRVGEIVFKQFQGESPQSVLTWSVPREWSQGVVTGSGHRKTNADKQISI